MVDSLISTLDKALRTLAARPRSRRQILGSTSGAIPEMSQEETQTSIQFMRINHAGEVCAQALYLSQALFSGNAKLAAALKAAASEEEDHLAWTEQRLDELGGHRSALAPIWFAGSFALGSLAAMAGPRANLSFLAETENQVARHLDDQLERLPTSDLRSRSILQQMRQDEAAHASSADQLGAGTMPRPLALGMRAAAGIMKAVAARY